MIHEGWEDLTSARLLVELWVRQAGGLGLAARGFR